jgi:hypothetical protein
MFNDGTFVDGHYHHTPHYHVISHRCGQQDNLLGYVRDHEFCHSFLWEKLFDEPSGVLWELAHKRMLPTNDSIVEEAAVQMFQRWLRTHERPIVSGGNWDAWKQEALECLPR